MVRMGYAKHDSVRYSAALKYIKLRWPTGAVAALSGAHRNVVRRWSAAYWGLRSGKHLTPFQDLPTRDRALLDAAWWALKQLSVEARRALAVHLLRGMS